MRILLTNDDGFECQGIKTLEQVLTQAGHEVWVLAPDGQRSGKSHAITIQVPLKLTKLSERHYSFEGTPADCVLFADKGMIDIPKPFVIIAGINRGYNISTDIIYSGTDGAASEGARCGYRSIAVSCYHDKEGNFVYGDAADFVAKHLDGLLDCCDTDCYININVPPYSNGEWEVAGIGHIEYYDNIVERTSDGHFTMDGIASPDIVEKDYDGSDFNVVHKFGKIAVSAIDIMPALNNAMNEKLKHLS